MTSTKHSTTTPPPESRGPDSTRLDGRQLGIVSGIGIVLWIAVACLVRFLSGIGAFDGAVALLTYVLSIASAPLTVWLLQKLAKLHQAQLVPAAAIGTAAASLCDGVALKWLPSLYGASAEDALSGGALILWGVGWLFVFAYRKSIQ